MLTAQEDPVTCEKDHKYTIIGTAEVTFDTPEEAQKFLEDEPDGAYWVAFHPGLIDQVIEDPDNAKTYCAEETAAREEAA